MIHMFICKFLFGQAHIFKLSVNHCWWNFIVGLKYRVLSAISSKQQTQVAKAASRFRMLSDKSRGDLFSQTKAVTTRVTGLKERWEKLHDLLAQRKNRLEEAIQSQQYHADANEAESWIKDREPLVVSNDYGSSEASAKVLLQLVQLILKNHSFLISCTQKAHILHVHVHVNHHFNHSHTCIKVKKCLMQCKC